MLADRVAQTSTTEGTGPYELDTGAVSAALQTFVAGAGNTAKVAVLATMGDQWEIVSSTIAAGTPDTLTRTLIRSSTGSLINWGVGTKLLRIVDSADIARFGAVGTVPTAGGTANAIEVDFLPAMNVMLPGMRACFIAAATNTGNVTLDTGPGAQPLRRGDASEVPAGLIYAGLEISATWDGTQWGAGPELYSGVVLLPGSGAMSAAASVDILLPAQFGFFEFDIFAKFSTDAAYMAVLTSTNGGSSFDTGGSDYQSAYSYMSNATTLTTASSALSAFGTLTTGADNAAASGQLINGDIFPGDGTRYPLINAKFGGTLEAGGGGFLGKGDSTTLRFSATRINAIRFIPSAGTITGRIDVRGKV